MNKHRLMSSLVLLTMASGIFAADNPFERPKFRESSIEKRRLEDIERRHQEEIDRITEKVNMTEEGQTKSNIEQYGGSLSGLVSPGDPVVPNLDFSIVNKAVDESDYRGTVNGVEVYYNSSRKTYIYKDTSLNAGSKRKGQ